MVEDPRGYRGVRRHTRYRVEALADINGTDVLYYQPIKDISMGGMRIETASREPLGSRVGVVLTFPGEEGAVTLSGEVVWATDGVEPEVGLRWRFPDARSRLRLSACLEHAHTTEVSKAPFDDHSQGNAW
jgi:hypothetical protein